MALTRAQKDTAQEVINAVDSRAGELSVDWSTIGQWRPVHNSITSAMPKPNKLATMRGSDGHYYIGICLNANRRLVGAPWFETVVPVVPGTVPDGVAVIAALQAALMALG